MKQSLEQRVAVFAGRHFGPETSVVRLAGDASDRAYFRLRGGAVSPLILMVHPEPFELGRMPYFLHATLLHGIGARVPQIVASYPAEGILVVQDLGDETLQERLRTCDPAQRRFLYLQAVRTIALLQQEGTRALTPEVPAAHTALDGDRLLFELRFFAEHYVHGLLGSPLSPEQDAVLDGWFVGLAHRVAAYPRVLCHRDYHSRNLMVKGDLLFMVDFQDARLGPYTYDLASLVRDSYVKVPEELEEEMIEFFREVLRSTEPQAAFREAFARTCLQRNIKAVGTFASQAVLRGNRGYLGYIAPTLESIRANLRRGDGDPSDRDIVGLFEGPLDYR